jgi:hypothetical protein
MAAQARRTGAVSVEMNGEIMAIRVTAADPLAAQRGARAAAAAAFRHASLFRDRAGTPLDEKRQYRLITLSPGGRPLRPDAVGHHYFTAAAVASGAALVMFVIALFRLLVQAARDEASDEVDGLLGHGHRGAVG